MLIECFIRHTADKMSLESGLRLTNGN